MDRRVVILGASAVGAAACIAGIFSHGTYYGVLIAAFVSGGMVGPLYSLLIAHTNDFLEADDMAGSSGGLIFINGVGAVGGPMITGWLMGVAGPSGFWIFQAVLLGGLTAYAAWRMTRRAAIPTEETASYVAVTPSSTPIASEVAQEWAIEQAEDEAAELEKEAEQVGN
jgi:MFS family permease